MLAAVWWTVGLAALVVLAHAAAGPARRFKDTLVRRHRAELRAEALLLDWLSSHQREQYRARGWFEVVTQTGHRYGIWPRQVVRLDGRRAAYCIEARSPVPVCDEMLAKKLLLETDEHRFLATAHRYR